MGSEWDRARVAAGQDEELRRTVEERHLRSGGPTAAELLAAGKLQSLLLLHVFCIVHMCLVG